MWDAFFDIIGVESKAQVEGDLLAEKAHMAAFFKCGKGWIMPFLISDVCDHILWLP